MRVYIEVIAVYTPKGELYPVDVVWKYSKYHVDRIINIKRRSSTKLGGTGITYTCIICGQQMHLYFEDEGNRWYLERRTA